MDFQEFSDAVVQRNFPIDFKGHWIGGKWRTLKNTKPLKSSINPNNGQDLITPDTDKEAVFTALDACAEIAPKLTQLKLEERKEIIVRMRQALGDYQECATMSMRVESGKPEWEARSDLQIAINHLDTVIEQGDEIIESILAPAKIGRCKGEYFVRPLGTTIAFLPFSTPMTNFSKYFANCMLVGSPLILCPSSHAVLAGLLFSYLGEKVELPEGSLNVCFGDFNSFKKILGDRRLQSIIYTGSREHCDMIARESRTVPGRQLVLQSGGKNAVLVHSSADLEVASRCVLQGALKSAGQLCTSTSRVFVHESILDDFTKKLLDDFDGLKYGRTDTDETDVYMGPVYSKKAVEKFQRYQTMAHREAAKDLRFGKAIENSDGACLVQPGIHLMKEFDNSSAYQSNVLFCPDLAIYQYSVLDTAIDQINTTDAPYVVSFIGDADTLKTRAQQFSAPNLLINMPTTEMVNTPSIAGKLQSGHHRFNGAGLALLLSYPQLIKDESDASSVLKDWP